jgi:hypothetical protein
MTEVLKEKSTSSFSVVGSVRHLKESYRRFVLSTYRLANDRLREQFESHVKATDVLIKGPYVTLAQDFETGADLASLIVEGAVHKDLGRLHWSFGSHALYAHQERALRAATEGRNVVVKTGTGSGKTEAFLLPVLSGVARLREQGVRGVKAILLYPMNALANDQLVRLRELVRDSGTGFSFALYTGDSDKVIHQLGGEPVEGLERVSYSTRPYLAALGTLNRWQGGSTSGRVRRQQSCTTTNAAAPAIGASRTTETSISTTF